MFVTKITLLDSGHWRRGRTGSLFSVIRVAFRTPDPRKIVIILNRGLLTFCGMFLQTKSFRNKEENDEVLSLSSPEHGVGDPDPG